MSLGMLQGSNKGATRNVRRLHARLAFEEAIVHGHTLCVYGAQIYVYEQAHQVALCRFLEGGQRRGLEPDVHFHIARDLSDQALEGQLADEKVR